MGKKWSIERQIVDYIGSLELVGGDKDGERFTVMPWQKRFIYGAWRAEGDSALSVGRGNGKSELVAALACAVLDPAGPLHGRRREVICVAASLSQARVGIFESVVAMLRQRYNLEDRSRWRKEDSSARATLEFRKTGARVRCIGAKPGTASGLKPLLVLADEPASWEKSQSVEMLSVLRTGLGKVPASKLIALGTRPASPEHWFQRALSGGWSYSQVHSAPKDAPPFQVRTLRRSNPMWDHLPSLRARIRQEMVDARADPEALASFRWARLNDGSSAFVRSMLLDAAAWQRAIDMGQPDARSPSYVLGVDVGGSAAMTGAAAYFRSGHLDAFAMFPEEPSLAARGLADGVGGLYQQMARRGELVTGGQYEPDIGVFLTEAWERWGIPQRVVVDTWRLGLIKQTLSQLRYPLSRVLVRRWGPYDGSADVRSFPHGDADRAGHARGQLAANPCSIPGKGGG